MTNKHRLCIELSIISIVVSAVWASARPSGHVETSQEKPNAAAQQLVGTWRLIAVKEKDGPAQEVPADQAQQIKQVTPTHYTWFRIDPKDHTTRIGFSGRYRVEGDSYMEYIDTVPTPLNGKEEPAGLKRDETFKATYRLEGDRWYHIYPLDRDKPDGDTFTEIYARMKSGEKFP